MAMMVVVCTVMTVGYEEIIPYMYMYIKKSYLYCLLVGNTEDAQFCFNSLFWTQELDEVLCMGYNITIADKLLPV